jgi:hypothetical protein
VKVADEVADLSWEIEGSLAVKLVVGGKTLWLMLVEGGVKMIETGDGQGAKAGRSRSETLVLCAITQAFYKTTASGADLLTCR